MCDEFEGPSVYKRRKLTARKPHRCAACKEKISPGDEYILHSGMTDSWWKVKQCIRCDAMTSEIASQTTESVELHLDCGETWTEALCGMAPDRYVAGTEGAHKLALMVDDNVPQRVQALAFQLPGDDADWWRVE
jgi:hypothetical protein